MRIAITTSGLEHVKRGVETWALETSRILRRLGQDVTLFKGSGYPRVPYERVCGCVRQGSGLNRLLLGTLPACAWRIGFGSDWAIEQVTFALNLIPKLGRGFDIVHTQDSLAALTLHRAWTLGLIKAPVILGHGTEEPFDFLAKLGFVQHLAPFYLEEARAAGCHKEGWTAIGNFVDTGRFQPGPNGAARAKHGLPQSAFVVLSVAAVKRTHKRVDYLIREVADFRRATGADVELVVAGASALETGGLVRMGKELLGERAHFLLDQPHESMPEVFRVADVFALCSLKEMMPLALLEAMASGLPCLVSAHPVVNWIIGPGGEGIRMEQPGALAGALARYSDPALRREKGALARQHVAANFAEEAIVRRYIDMYCSVLEIAGRAA